MKNISRGFTLIELLVVLGILGILAAALIATIDPFEQLKKSQDTNLKNIAVEYLNANIRYYTTHNIMVWEAGVAGCAAPTTAGTALNAATINGCITALITDGELKSGFGSASGLSQITGYTTAATGSTDLFVCFVPTSKSQKMDPNTKYTNTGATGTCTAPNCNWCAM